MNNATAQPTAARDASHVLQPWEKLTYQRQYVTNQTIGCDPRSRHVDSIGSDIIVVSYGEGRLGI